MPPHALEMESSRATTTFQDRENEGADGEVFPLHHRTTYTTQERRKLRKRTLGYRVPYHRAAKNAKPRRPLQSRFVSGPVIPPSLAAPVSTTQDATPTGEPKSSQSTFDNTGVANITGGIFVNVQNSFSAERRSISTKRRRVAPRVSVMIESEVNDNKGGITSMDGLVRDNDARVEQPQKADYDIYYHQFLLKRRGSPMWIPGPDMNLPTEYRREGINIGDLCILYRAEGFSYLFNIFLPADHPVNIGRVPAGFEPLDPSYLQNEVKRQVVFGPKDYVVSGSERISTKMDSSGYVFDTSASEGAILVMPNGAITVDLLSRQSIKAYIAKHAKNWYEFVTQVRHREVEDGEIRLVMGFDKASTWGIATFCNSVEEQAHLQFSPVDGVGWNNTQAYEWRYICGGSGRAGPHEEEMQDIRCPSDTSILRNQCMFVRTMNFCFSGETGDNSTVKQVRPSDHLSDYGGPQPPPNLRRSGPGTGGGGFASNGKSSGNQNLHARQCSSSVVHPSDLINKFLLSRYPEAQIAITEDADWISLITNDDAEFPGSEELCSRLLASCEISCKDGIVGFEPAKELIVVEDSKDHSVLEFLSSHLWIPDVMEVDEEESTPPHRNWMSLEEVLCLNDDTSEPELTIGATNEEMNLKKQGDTRRQVYERQWWQSTPTLSFEDAQPVWLLNSLEAETTTPTRTSDCDDVVIWPIQPLPSPPPAFRDYTNLGKTFDNPKPEPALRSLKAEGFYTPKYWDVLPRHRKSKSKVERINKIGGVGVPEFQDVHRPV